MAQRSPDVVANAHRDTRRVIQVLAPAVPLPVIDYVTSSFFSPRSKSMDVDAPPKRFQLRKMDSGPMSQFSLTSPTLTTRSSEKFKDSDNFDFAMEAGSGQKHVSGGTAMASLSMRS